MCGKYHDLFVRMKIRNKGNERELKIEKKVLLAHAAYHTKDFDSLKKHIIRNIYQRFVRVMMMKHF